VIRDDDAVRAEAHGLSVILDIEDPVDLSGREERPRIFRHRASSPMHRIAPHQGEEVLKACAAPQHRGNVAEGVWAAVEPDVPRPTGPSQGMRQAPHLTEKLGCPGEP
jgi:hypothetical protein